MMPISTIAIPGTIRAHAKAAHQEQSRPPIAHWGTEVVRILCIRPDNLGDVIMASPAMLALKQAYPNRHLTLLASGSGVAAARFIPEIDDVMPFDPPWARHDAAAGSRESEALISTMRAGAFDAAVIFTSYSQSALPAAMLCFMAGIPRRLAYCRENPYSIVSDWVPEREPESGILHEVERQLTLVARVGAGPRPASIAHTPASPRSKALTDGVDDGHRRGVPLMRFALSDDDVAGASRILDSVAPNGLASPIVMHAGATASSRRYPPERFATIAAELGRRTGRPIVLTGDAKEADLASQVRRLALKAWPAGSASVISLAGRLTLGQLGAVLQRAALLVSNNSGPVHIAAALGTPIVVLYALTNPQHTPWGVPHRTLFFDVPCRWCYKSDCPERHHRCLLGVPTETVVTQALSLLEESEIDPGAASPSLSTEVIST